LFSAVATIQQFKIMKTILFGFYLSVQ